MNKSINIDNLSTRKFTNKLATLILLTFMTSTISSTALAGGSFGKGHHRGGDMMKPIERMIDHLDLTDSQEQQAEDILKNARSKTKDMMEMKHHFFKKIISNNPDSSDYMAVAEAQAEEISKAVKTKVLLMAKVRQEVYAILTDEQKEALAKHAQKKLKRMENK